MFGRSGSVVPRTIAIDEAVRARSAPQLVILGAGLDGRVWRMAELADVEAYEVDHSARSGTSASASANGRR